LLAEGEQRAFRRLASFAGGCTLAAAEAVGADRSLDVLDGLAALVEQSLVRREEPDGETHFVMLETIREYALEQLGTGGDGEAVRRRHAAYFLELAEAAEPHLAGPEQVDWLRCLDRERDNLRAALAWALERGESDLEARELGARLGGALWHYWDLRSTYTEGWERLQALRAQLSPAWDRGVPWRALYGAGSIAFYRGDLSEARALLVEALHRAREAGDQTASGTSLHRLGATVFLLGDHEAGRAMMVESLGILRELGNRYEVARVLNNLGAAECEVGDPTAATPYLEESLAIARQVGDRYLIGLPLHMLGAIALARGDRARARSLLAERVALARELGDKGAAAWSLRELAEVAVAEGDYRAARAQFLESLTMHHEVGELRHAASALDALARLATAMAQPRRASRLAGAAAGLRAAWPAGQAMSLEQAVAYALEDASGDDD
jgi:tetratricopeptide (TPR) repeat protein